MILIKTLYLNSLILFPIFIVNVFLVLLGVILGKILMILQQVENTLYAVPVVSFNYLLFLCSGKFQGFFRQLLPKRLVRVVDVQELLVDGVAFVLAEVRGLILCHFVKYRLL